MHNTRDIKKQSSCTPVIDRVFIEVTLLTTEGRVYLPAKEAVERAEGTIPTPSATPARRWLHGWRWWRW